MEEIKENLCNNRNFEKKIISDEKEKNKNDNNNNECMNFTLINDARKKEKDGEENKNEYMYDCLEINRCLNNNNNNIKCKIEEDKKEENKIKEDYGIGEFMLNDVEWKSLLYANSDETKVYEGINTINNIAVALKCVYIENKKKCKQLKNEYNLLSRLKIKNIAKTYGLFRTKNMLVLVTEFFEGGNLYDLFIKNGRIKESDVKIFLQSLLKTLEKLHENKIVHRDIKLDNLALRKINDYNSVSLIDFEFAAEEKSEGEMCRICGSLGSTAPEVLMGKKHDSKADIFSAGIAAYILLVGVIPFISQNIYISFRLNCIGKLDLNLEECKNISSSALNLIEWMCMRNPELRCSAKQALKHPWIST